MSGVTVQHVRLTAQWQALTWWGGAEAISLSRLERVKGQQRVGELRDITFRNIQGASEGGVVIVGGEGLPIGRVALRRMRLELQRLTSFQGGVRDLRPGTQGLETNVSIASLYARNVDELELQVSALAICVLSCIGRDTPNLGQYSESLYVRM
jgi:hypothetical protein